MDASLIPYRKVTLRGVAFVKGEIELKEIIEQLPISFGYLKIHGNENIYYKRLLEWQIRAQECLENPEKIESFKEWIKTQDIYGINS